MSTAAFPNYFDHMQSLDHPNSLYQSEDLPWESPLMLDGGSSFDTQSMSPVFDQDGISPACLMKSSGPSMLPSELDDPLLHSPDDPNQTLDFFDSPLDGPPTDPAWAPSSLSTSPRSTAERRSCTPSLCGDLDPAASPERTPTNASHSLKTPPQTPPPSARRAGDGKAKKRQPTGRMTHRQVERRYREGINRELEQLRLAVPATRARHEWAGKPSKGVVLSSAIAYIRALEKEVERGNRERVQLRGLSTSLMRRLRVQEERGF